MMQDVFSQYPDLPDVWGEGAIFAFSGMDGDTDTASGFVATYASEPYGLLFHTPHRRIVEVPVGEGAAVRIATNDLYAVETPAGDLLVTYSAWHTLVGTMPEGTAMVLRLEGGPEAEEQEGLWVSADPRSGDALVGAQDGTRFALAYGGSPAEAAARARAGLHADLPAVVAARLAIYGRTPRAGGLQRLMNKCISVMKVNTLSPEGAISRRWSTPDRVPHRHLWLWDSVFHSLAMNHLDPELSWDLLAAVLDAQRPDGLVPHMTQVSGRQSQITQPPLLAWGVWENYQVLRDADRLRQALPALERYLAWDLQNRDANANGLLEWHIEGNPRSRSGESGLDNSPRFDAAAILDAVDFSTFAAHDMAHLARIAQVVGDSGRADLWHRRADEMATRIHTLLWDSADAFYYDLNMEGSLTRVRAATGFLPLLLGEVPEGRVDALVAALGDPAHFATAFPVPTVATSDPEYSTDMWRGATWVNINYLIVLGLRKHGREDEAQRLAGATIAFVDRYYREYGVLFEFYDSADRVPPPECDRKGPRVAPYDIRRKMDSIRDYHWTAALTACLLIDGYRPASI